MSFEIYVLRYITCLEVEGLVLLVVGRSLLSGDTSLPLITRFTNSEAAAFALRVLRRCILLKVPHLD